MSSSSALVAAGESLGQVVGQLALLGDRRDDGRAPRLQLAQIDQPFRELAQLRVVQPAGHFLAVARDEGHRRAFVEQPDGRRHLRAPAPISAAMRWGMRRTASWIIGTCLVRGKRRSAITRDGGRAKTPGPDGRGAGTTPATILKGIRPTACDLCKPLQI